LTSRKPSAGCANQNLLTACTAAGPGDSTQEECSVQSDFP
jgi:hypothetical protein